MYLSDKLINRYGIRPVLAGGMGLLAVGTGFLSVLPSDGSYWFSFFPGFLLVGTGFGLAYPSSTVGAVTDVERSRHGMASGLQQTSWELGGGSGLAIYTAIAVALTGFGSSGVHTATAFIGGFRTAMAVAAVIAVVATLVALTLRSGIEVEAASEISQKNENPLRISLIER